MRSALLLLAAVLLSGCDDFDGPPPALQRTTSVITLSVDPQLKTP